MAGTPNNSVTIERIRAFLLTFYSASSARDLTQLMNKYMNEQCTGDWNNRWKKLETDAS